MNRTIASLALVKVNWDVYRKDYIENFVPFIATLINRKKYTSIDCSNLNVFLNDFADEFGLLIPYHPMLSILDRARKREIVTRREHGVLIPNRERTLKYDFSGASLKKEAEFNKLLDSFIKYCSSRFNFNISKQDAENAFLVFLKRHDLDILFASQSASLLPDNKPNRQIKYLFHSFINDLKSTDPISFEVIRDISLGHILANTILYENNFSKFTGKLKGVGLYLDSKFVFRLLGAEGEAYKGAYSELAKSMLDQGASLFIFRHTLDEILFIANNALRYIDAPDYDPSKASEVLRYFVMNKMASSDIHLFITTIEDKLNDLKIAIKNAPEFFNTTLYQIGESKLEEIIIQTYKERSLFFDPITKKDTILRDIKSISSIHHYRQGSLPQSIRQSKALFVTTNFSLALAVKKFEDIEFKGVFHIPACVTDVFVGTLAWIQSPTKWLSLNERRLIADCIAALQPDDYFIKRIIDEISKLKESGGLDDAGFRSLSCSYVLRDLLMERTLGDPEQITPSVIEDALDGIRIKAAHDANEKLVEEKRLRERVEEKNLEYESRNDRQKAQLKQWAGSISRVVFCSCALIFIIAAFVQTLNMPIKIKWLLWILMTLIAFFDFAVGVNLKDFRLFLENKIYSYLVNIFELK